MASEIARNRDVAAERQDWLCCYCGMPMGGEGSPYASALTTMGRRFSVTAEHLQSRKDGGGDGTENIAAAHDICNRRRHRCKKPAPSECYGAHVRERVAVGRWFAKSELAQLKVLAIAALAS